MRCEEAAIAAADGSSDDSLGVLPSGMVGCCIKVGEAFFGVELSQKPFLVEVLRVGMVAEVTCCDGGADVVGDDNASWLLFTSGY